MTTHNQQEFRIDDIINLEGNTMTEENLIKWEEEGMPNIVEEKLAAGQWASYRSDEYPGKLLREFPNGRLESVTIDLETEEIIVLEVLKNGRE